MKTEGHLCDFPGCLTDAPWTLARPNVRKEIAREHHDNRCVPPPETFDLCTGHLRELALDKTAFMSDYWAKTVAD